MAHPPAAQQQPETGGSSGRQEGFSDFFVQWNGSSPLPIGADLVTLNVDVSGAMLLLKLTPRVAELEEEVRLLRQEIS